MGPEWCWWCCHPFDGPVLHLPHKYDDMRKRFETMGNFCSWGCMKTFNMDTNKTRAGIIGGNIVMLHKAMYGHVKSIRCAPNRFALQEFGGTLSIEEFRKMTDYGGNVLVNMPNELHKIQDVVINREIRFTSINEQDNKFQEISRSVSTNDTLKLKRQKPLKREENNLEKSMGITRKK